VEAAGARGPRTRQAALGLCHNLPMLRGPLLIAVLLALLGLGAQQSSSATSPYRPHAHERNGRIAYEHVGNGNRFQIYTMTATGAHRHRLTTGHRYSSYDPAYAPGGKRIAFVRAYKQSDLWSMNANGTGKRRLTSTPGVHEVDPAWSPDGKQVAFAVESPVFEHGIWVIDADGGGRRQLTNGLDTQPSWSPDGSEIAFQRNDPSTEIDTILVVPPKGGTAVTLSSDPGVSDLEPAWSPDGSRILFVSDRPDMVQLDLWTMSTDGTHVTRVTNTPNRDEHDPAWSPDGRRIVYSGNGAFHGASSSQLYVSDANGEHRRKLTHACGECAWINGDPSWQPLPG
jgi:Tol biopolymer transport system component